MNEIAVSTAGAGDAAGLAALVERAFAPWAAIIGRRPAPMDDDYGARAEAGQLYAVSARGAVCGAIVLEAEPGNVLLLDTIAVEPGCQGGGLGRAMLAWVEQEAARRGCVAVRLFTHERMDSNVRMYLRWGFRETHRLEQDGMRRVFMSKRMPDLPPAWSKPR